MGSILPPHPYRVSPVFVRRYRKHALLAWVVAVLFLLFVAYEFVEVRQMATERRIWATGLETREVSWKGTRHSSRRGGITYDLNVRFLDANRVERGGRVYISTLYGSIDTVTPPTVHYLPQHPDSFAFSKAIGLMPERANSAMILLVASAAIVAIFGWFGLRMRRAISATRACALGSDEVELTVVLKERTGQGLRFKLRGETPWGTPLKATLGPDFGMPVFVDRGQTKVLALVSRAFPSVPVVMREGLLPYEFSPAEAVSIAGRITDGLNSAFRSPAP